jgi:hypothetical protein
LWYTSYIFSADTTDYLHAQTRLSKASLRLLLNCFYWELGHTLGHMFSDRSLGTLTSLSALPALDKTDLKLL